MIFEYAVEPEVLCKTENIRYLLDNFDVEEGRLIADYPKRWVAAVYRMWASKLKSVERRRFQVLLESLAQKVLEKETSRRYEGEDWLQNAEAVQEHGREPFRAILASSNPRSHPAVLIADDVNKQTPLWQVKRQVIVERQPRALSDVAAPLLHISKEILFIDPYFDPCDRRFQSSLRNMLFHLGRRRGGVARVELHCCIHPSSGTTFWEDCADDLPSMIPDGLELTVVRWNVHRGGDRFHRRYVLTECGGIAYEGGLDKGRDGETTDVYLLETDLRTERWNQYQEDSTAFTRDPDGPLLIVGTRPTH